MKRAIISAGLALLLVPVFALPAQAYISTPVSGEVLRGIRTISEVSGGEQNVRNMDENTTIYVYDGPGNLVAAWGTGAGGPLAVSWVTENHPNGAYRIRSTGKFCKRKVFKNCVDSETRDLSHFWVTVQNITAIAYQGATSGVWDDTATMAATVWDATTGWAVPNRWVRFVIGDQTGYGLTNASGYATASVKIGGSGTTTATANFDGDAYYVGSSAASSFSVMPVPAAVTVEGPFSAAWGNEVTVSAVLHKAAPRSGALVGRPVTLSLGPRSASGLSDAAGRFSRTFLLDFDPGSYPLTLSFAGDAQVQATSGTATFGSQKRGTSLVYAGAASTRWGDEAEFAAYLLDPAGDVGVWGEVVRFQMGSKNVTAVTDIDGLARVMVPMTDDPGSYPVTVSYNPSASRRYAASSNTSALTIVRRPVTMTLAAPESGRWKEQISATVTLRDFVTGDPVAKPVAVSLGTVNAGGPTSSSGAATFTLSLTDVPGAYGLTSSFAGDMHYLPASVTNAFEMLRRPVAVRYDGQRRADAAITGPSHAYLGARVTDGVTGEPVPWIPLEISAMDVSVSLIGGSAGEALTAVAVPRAPGLYPITASALGTPYYLPGMSTSLSTVGWETFIDPGDGGAVFLDVVGKRVRAISPLNNPTVDTGALDAPGLTQNADGTFTLGYAGENQKVSGTFDTARATFTAQIEEVSGSYRSLARLLNTPPQVAAPADLSTHESAAVPLSATTSDADGDALYTWWDFGDLMSAPEDDVLHTFDDTVVDDRVFVVTVTVADEAGARARDTLVVNVADVDAPDAPVIALPAEGAALPSGSISVSGTVEPSARVTLTDRGVAIPGSATANETGGWALNVTLSEGAHVLQASAVDVDGYPSPPSGPRAFLVDLTAPAVALTGPAARGYNESGWSAGCGLCGTASDDGSGLRQVEVSVARASDGATFDGTSFVAGDPRFLGVTGSQSWARASSFGTFGTDGVYTVTARATDAAGNRSLTPARQITIDSVTPDAPVITGPIDGVTINTTEIQIVGTAEAGATVRLLDGGIAVAELIAPDGGAWSATATLDRGPHTLTADATDPAGSTSALSAPVGITIDTDVPAPPRLGSPAEGASLKTGSFTVRGDAERASTVRLYDAGVPLAHATATNEGTFAIDVVLAEGTHTLTATATDAGTNVSEPSAVRALTVDLTAPPLPRITRPGEGAALSTLAPSFQGTSEAGAKVLLREGAQIVGTAYADGDGAWATSISLPEGAHTLTAAAVDAATNEGAATSRTFVLDVTPPGAPQIVTPDDGVAVSSTVAHLAGTANPGDGVVLSARRAGNATQSAAVAVATGGDGRWAGTLDLGEGDYVVTATITDAAGNASTDIIAIRLDVTPPGAPRVISPLADAGYGTGTIGSRGTAEPGARIEIAEAGVVIGLATALSDATWSATLQLADGVHTLEVKAIDAAGNRSALTRRVFEVDATPDTPRIFSPLAGARIDGRIVPVTGEGPAGGTVEILEDGAVIASARITAASSFAMELPFAEGPHVITARVTDPAGNVAPLSDARPFTIDTAAPLIVTPRQGATSGAHTLISGNALPGEPLAILEGGDTIATTVAGGDGSFSLVLVFDGGRHEINAARIENGTTRAPSAPRAFTVDATAPTATVAADARYLPGDQITVTGTASDESGVGRIEVRYTETITRQAVVRVPVCIGCAPMAASVTFTDRPALSPGLWRADVYATDRYSNRSERVSTSFIRV